MIREIFLLSFNTSYVSVQVSTGPRYITRENLFQYILCFGSSMAKKVWKEDGFQGFNTSYVSVQAWMDTRQIRIKKQVSIHPMFRFKDDFCNREDALYLVSIHPMFRFKTIFLARKMTF